MRAWLGLSMAVIAACQSREEGLLVRCQVDSDCVPGFACGPANLCIGGVPQDVATPPEFEMGADGPGDAPKDSCQSAGGAPGCDGDDASAYDACESGCADDVQTEGCVGAADCHDGNPCTIDACVSGACVHKLVAECCAVDKDCADGDECTEDSCTEQACQHVAVAGCCTEASQCNDGKPCTKDACVDGTCTHSAIDDCCTTTAECDDGTDCTTDVCLVAMTTCKHDVLPLPGCCKTDKYCSGGGECMTGACIGNECTYSTSPDGTYCGSSSDMMCFGGVCQLLGFKKIFAGTFVMGSPPDEPGRSFNETQHTVTITRDYYIKEAEVSQHDWKVVMDNWPSYFSGCKDACPVENVSWWDAVAYCNQLSYDYGLEACYALSDCTGVPGDGTFVCADASFLGLDCPGFRLPTEAEWEFAVRAGTTTAIYTGPITILGQNNVPELALVAEYSGNSSATYPGAVDCSEWPQKQFPSTTCGPGWVKNKLPNAWGLHDMLGNVFEWCHDWSGGGADYAPDPVVDPLGPPEGFGHRMRGGAFTNAPTFARAAARSGASTESTYYFMGFRPARTVGP